MLFFSSHFSAFLGEEVNPVWCFLSEADPVLVCGWRDGVLTLDRKALDGIMTVMSTYLLNINTQSAVHAVSCYTACKGEIQKEKSEQHHKNKTETGGS